ncbi:MAG: phosphopyruvate hydratase [Planctomycetes bacterium]|nr:phosphopyruvate hydratase [Planctomycetota bacterium]
MAKISAVYAAEVLDSRGDPTLEVEIRCDDGSSGRAIVPAGASTGKAEAHELRDGDPARYDGRGVLQAVNNVRTLIARAVIGADPVEQFTIDSRLCELDASPHKHKLGANALLGVSLATAHAAAESARIPLYRHINSLWQRVAAGAPVSQPRIPLPMTNMISGGAHAGRNLDFQDFLVMPVGAVSYAQALEWIVRVSRRLGKVLTDAGYEGRLVGDEGGYGPRLKNSRHAMELLVRAIEAARLRPGEDVTVAIDVASTQFFDGTHYQLSDENKTRLTNAQMVDLLEQLIEEFPLIASIEDGMAEDDWEGWQMLTRRIGSRVRLIGDDLFATHEDRLRRGISLGAANGILIKPNQVGTLSETLRTMRLAQSSNYSRIISARSGETEDTTIADLAVGTATKNIKIGAIQRSERLAKYNRLLRIEQEIGEDRINW